MILTKEYNIDNKGLLEQKASVNLEIKDDLVWINYRAV